MKVSKNFKRLVPVVMAFAMIAALTTTPASAATFTSLSLLQSDPTPSATSNHTVTLSSQTTATTVRCVTVTYNTAADGSGSTPSGFDATAATWSGTFVTGGFGSWTPANAAGQAKITDATGAAPTAGAGRTIILTGVTNGSTPATSYYAIVQTWTDAGCTTPTGGVDSGVVAFQFTANTTVSVTVDPSLTFTVANKNSACNGQTPTAYVDNSGGGATSLPLGNLAGGNSKGSAQTLTLGTNAGNGFTVYLRGAHASVNMRNAGNTEQINDVSSPYSSPAGFGAGEAFGYTVLDSTSGTAISFGGNNFAALDDTNRAVMSGGAGTFSGSSCVGYQVGASSTTPAGSYSATVIYTAVPVF